MDALNTGSILCGQRRNGAGSVAAERRDRFEVRLKTMSVYTLR